MAVLALSTSGWTEIRHSDILIFFGVVPQKKVLKLYMDQREAG